MRMPAQRPRERGRLPGKKRECPLLTELPQEYDTTRVILMDIDPYWVFAYWEIAGQQLARARKRLGRRGAQSSPVLRVYELAHAAPRGTRPTYSFDIQLSAGAGNWYINLWSPQRTVYAELGLKEEQGRFIVLARSNRLETPPAQGSEQRGETWFMVGRRLTGGPARAFRLRRKEAEREGPAAPQPAPRLDATGEAAPAGLAHYTGAGVSVIRPVEQAPRARAAFDVLLAGQTRSAHRLVAGSRPVIPMGGQIAPCDVPGEARLRLDAVIHPHR